jgi:hypothetical protein
MDKDSEDSPVINLRHLYMGDIVARQFFEWVGSRQNDARFTNVDRIEDISNASRAEAINFCKKIDQLGYGKFVVGRKGRKSRIEWNNYTLLSLGEVARGIGSSLREIGVKEDRAQIAKSEIFEANLESSELRPLFTIHMAKERLAESLGVSPDAIEITIRA